MSQRGRPKRGRTFHREEALSVLTEAARRGVVADPGWSHVGRAPWSASALATLDVHLFSLLRRLWTSCAAQPDFFGGVRAGDALAQIALHETLLASAEALWVLGGHEEVDRDAVEEAARNLARFCQDLDMRRFLLFYWAVTAYVDYGALHFYRELTEAEFVSGQRHRPWSEYRLSEGLRLALELGHVERLSTALGHEVRLTDSGRCVLATLHELMRASGTEALWRRLYVFGLQERGGVELAGREAWLCPALASLRADLVRRAVEPRSGWKVLEVGAGRGELTLDAGLISHLGPEARLTVTDPSRRRLERLKERAACAPPEECVVAAAERLPFPDGTFDLVIGSLFLHETDLPLALAEMARVLAPGGRLALLTLTGVLGPQEVLDLWSGAEPSSSRWCGDLVPPGQLTEGLVQAGLEPVLQKFTRVLVHGQALGDARRLLLEELALWQVPKARLPHEAFQEGDMRWEQRLLADQKALELELGTFIFRKGA